MERENLRVIISKKMIKEGLLRCLKNKSIDRISITELCREAQVNRSTFYNHYQQPKDVLDEISWEIINSVEEIFKQNKPTREKTVELLYMLKENEKIMKIIFSANVVEPNYSNVIKAFSHFWNSSSKLKEKKKLDDEQFQLAITGYGWAGYHIMKQWIMEDIDKSPEELVDLFDMIFMTDFQ